jgi:hypothetical protein
LPSKKKRKIAIFALLAYSSYFTLLSGVNSDLGVFLKVKMIKITSFKNSLLDFRNPIKFEQS